MNFRPRAFSHTWAKLPAASKAAWTSWLPSSRRFFPNDEESASCRRSTLRRAPSASSLMACTFLHGVLAIRANNQPQTLLVMPPLVIAETDVDEIVASIGEAAMDVTVVQ